MAKEDRTSVRVINQHGPFGFVMFVAWIGAFVYFVHAVRDFGGVLWAFVEACVWPGILTYHVLRLVGA